jgi:bacterial/archaeal transporter family protein
MGTAIISIISGIAGMIGWGLYDFLGGVYTKKIGSVMSLFWSQLAGLISVILLLFFFTINVSLPNWVLALLPIAAIVYSAGYLFFFKGFELGNVSIVAATMNLWAVFTMFFAFVFMGQMLSLVQFLGVLMIIFGVILAALNLNNIRNRKYKISSGIKETVFGAFFFGVFWNISEVISEEIGWFSTTLLVKIGVVLFLLIFSFVLKQDLNIVKSTTKIKIVIVIMGVIELVAVAIVNYGLTIGDAILITPIASALTIVTILLAIIFLKESVTRIQSLGMAMAVSGIIITAF